jgi:ClpP class serine protease
MALLGFPMVRYISIQDSEQVLRAIRLTDPKVPIQLVLHTPGGLVLASVQIARAIKRHKGKVTVYVPHYAMSGGTLIAIAGDEIVMSEDAVLGPVDPQVGPYPAVSVVKAVEAKPIADVDDTTLIMADQSRKALDQVSDTVEELLTDQLGAEKAKALAELLSEGTWTHDFAITYEAAKKLGLNVSDEMPTEILELMDLYPQPVRRHPSVTYLPSRRRAPKEEVEIS